MRNTTLAKFANSVPYVKELRPLAKSAMGCILLKQLDYWTFRMIEKGRKKGFYKFLSPTYELNGDGTVKKDAAGNPIIQERNGYKKGKSWCEELGFSEDEFITAFSHFGIRYGSKKAIMAAQDAGNIFKRKEGGRDALYVSFYDRQTHKTWYIRNHALVDSLIDNLFNAATVTGKEGWISPGKSDYSTPENPDTVTGDLGFLITTEITSPETTAETTSENKTPVPGERDPRTLPFLEEEDAAGLKHGKAHEEAGQSRTVQPISSTATPSAQPGDHSAPAACGHVDKSRRPARGQHELKHDPFMFGKFWEQYPRKEAKQDAVKIWNALKPDDDTCRAILHDVAKRKAGDAQWLKDGGQFIPFPSTYLNKKRWEDEWAPIKPGQPPPGPRAPARSAQDRMEADLDAIMNA